MNILNNCDELLRFMWNILHGYGSAEEIMFQGDVCEVGGMNPGLCPIVALNVNYPDTIWVIGDHNLEYTNTFILGAIQYGSRLDEVLGIVLPGYVYNELIATILNTIIQISHNK